MALCARAHWRCAAALGFVRRACDGARVLAALGGLDSSGVACAGTSSEEGEAYHARAKTNHKHVPAGKVRVRLDTRGYITRLSGKEEHKSFSFVALQVPAGQAATPGAQTRGAPTTPGAPHPIGPSSSPLRPLGLVCGCSLACAITSWRSQAPPCGRLRKLTANPRLLLRYADPTQCALASAIFFRRALRHAHMGVP